MGGVKTLTGSPCLCGLDELCVRFLLHRSGQGRTAERNLSSSGAFRGSDLFNSCCSKPAPLPEALANIAMGPNTATLPDCTNPCWSRAWPSNVSHPCAFSARSKAVVSSADRRVNFWLAGLAVAAARAFTSSNSVLQRVSSTKFSRDWKTRAYSVRSASMYLTSSAWRLASAGMGRP
jgi:hypothetical protein